MHVLGVLNSVRFHARVLGYLSADAASSTIHLSGPVTVEGDRAILLRIMQIVTSAVRVVLLRLQKLQVHSFA